MPPAAPTTGTAPGQAGGKTLVGKFELTPETAMKLMPHTEGTTWTYSLDIQQQRAGAPAQGTTSEIVYKIDAAKKNGDATDFLLGIYQDGKKKDEQMWSAGPKGVFQVSMGPTRRAFDPPQPVFTIPIKVGEEYNWSGTSTAVNGRRIPSKLTGQAIGTQTVDTSMGPADAVLFESQSTFEITAKNGQKAPAATITDSWFRPGVGIVRYQQSTRAANAALVYTLRLKSYKIN